jgi:hypothetical protein
MPELTRIKSVSLDAQTPKIIMHTFGVAADDK